MQKKTSPDSYSPSLVVGVFATLPSPSSTNPTACNSVFYSNWSSVLASGIKDILVTSTSFTNYTVVSNYVPTSTYNFLSILGYGGSTSATVSSIEINSITITEQPSFTIASSTNITCGSTDAKTFTVSNNYNTPGVTGYTWNLGANNNWLWGGNPAPATIPTGSVNNITLTPACGTKPSNISATVAIGSTNWNTNTATISIITPSMSMAGNTSFCSGTSSYSITGLPCNATVSWSINPTGPATLSTSGNNATLTYATSGTTTITAAINACGSITNLNKTIAIGVPSAATGIDVYGNGYDGTDCIDPGAYRAEAITTFTSPQYEWLLPSGITSTASGGSNPFLLGTTGFDIPIAVSGSFSSGNIRVRAVNGCGYSSPTFVHLNSCGLFLAEIDYSISPNPSNGTFNLSSTKPEIEEVQLLDKNGNVKKSAKFASPTNSYLMDASFLPSDLYFVKIFNGKKWVTKQVKINK